MNNNKVHNFYDEVAGSFENLSPEKGTATYHFRFIEYETGEWEDDNRPRLDLTTEVVCGEFAGRRGPRYTLTLGASEGETKGGRHFAITEEQAIGTVQRFVKAVLGDLKLVSVSEDATYEQILEAVGEAVTDRDFIGRVRRDDNGYDRLKSPLYTTEKPPKRFSCDCLVSAFV